MSLMSLTTYNVIADTRASNARVAFHCQVVTEIRYDFVNLLSQFAGRSENQSLTLVHAEINPLQDTNSKSGGLASTRLSLAGEGENSLGIS
jgi:hypothetical protein